MWDALDGRVGAMVAGVGTAGTLLGLAKYGLDHDPDTYVAAVEPEGSLFARSKGADVAEADYKTEGILTHGPGGTNELFEPDRVATSSGWATATRTTNSRTRPGAPPVTGLDPGRHR